LIDLIFGVLMPLSAILIRVYPFLLFTKQGANPGRIGDRLV